MTAKPGSTGRIVAFRNDRLGARLITLVNAVRLSQTYDLQAFALNTHENQVQLKAYQHAYENFGHECDWLAFIDGDEFLFPTAAPSLADALAPHQYRKVSAVTPMRSMA